MKKLILIAAILLCASLAYADADERYISVTGYGEIEIAPDTANLSLGFRTVNNDLVKAKAEMTQKMDALINALKQFKISEKDIQATQLYIYPRYVTAKDGVENVMQGYDVSRTITVAFKDLTQTDAILEAAIKAGANTFNGLNFSYSKEDELRQDALVKAINNANQQAQFLANRFGVTLGKLKTASTSQQYYGVRAENAAMLKMADSAGGQGYTPGLIKVSAQVNAAFIIN